MIKRRKTREVLVGDIGIGGNNPIRIQSMTTSKTHDISATVAQILHLEQEGCEIARITVQGMREARACENIKNELVKHHCDLPLVADIHFYPPAALHVVDFVEKVRINPGNFAGKHVNIEDVFVPLVEKCQKLGRALRIGANLGSLSERIMQRHGDTPRGMVESALEYAEICRKHDYHDIIFSMKASNVRIMIEAYRLLVNEMDIRKWDYPLHLGVTEAGEGSDGRLTSAAGIGTLLSEGLGDTIRVSLTEDPWHEIEPARQLVSWAEASSNSSDATFETITSPLPKLRKKGNLFVCSDDLENVSEHADGIITSKPMKEEKTTMLQSWDGLGEPQVVFYTPPENNDLHSRRLALYELKNKNITVILKGVYDLPQNELSIIAGAECANFFVDGLCQGIMIKTPYDTIYDQKLALSILQTTGQRVTKTEFISCPGCGRTLYDIQNVVQRIKKKMSHLHGIKIAIMGCIVNGPGEMADADFGFVGSKPGKIDLYVGKQCVERNIDFDMAEEHLEKLIKRHNCWIDYEE